MALVDKSFAIHEANQGVISSAITEGVVPDQSQYDQVISKELQGLSGSRRYFDIPKAYFKDINAKVSIHTTNEQRNKTAMLQSLSQILKDVTATYNPQTGTFAILENPVLARMFGAIIENSGTGLSPISLGIGKEKIAQQPMQPMIPNAQPNATQLTQAI